MRTLKKDIEDIINGCEVDDPFCGVINGNKIANRIISHYNKFIEWIREEDRCPTLTIRELYKKWIKSMEE